MTDKFSPENLDALRRQLASDIKGDVLTDDVSLGLYSTDASLYQITPLAVVLPRDRFDVLAAIRICSGFGAPIVPRGGGTSLSGQTVGRAVVIDASRHMRALIELNVEERWVRVQPGLVRDELNVMLKPHGLHFAPDPATSNRANVGGMIANNTGGMRSIRYGTTIDHVLELDLALAGGEVLHLGPLSPEAYAAAAARPGREGEILSGFRRVIEANRDEIEARFPKVRRNSGGYLLNAFHHLGPKDPWNAAKLISGSEGSLGMILEAKLNLEPLPKFQGLCIAHFETLAEALRALAPIDTYKPTAVELLDKTILELARDNLLTRDLCGFMVGHPGTILIIEAAGDTIAAVQAQLGGIAAHLQSRGMGYAWPMILDRKGQSDVWLMRTNGLGIMSTVKGEFKPQPFIEDPAVPLEAVPEYIAEVLAVCERHHRPVAVYAHAGAGLLHVRPMLNLHNAPEVALMKELADEVFQLVLRFHGCISGEHGDGLVRSHYNEAFYGPKLYAAFKEIKRLFDPRGLFNPGKVVNGPPMTENLRFQVPGYALKWTENMFHYRDDGGLLAAVEKCNGVGACRKSVNGVMCPSYIVTRNEEHSTRGRANVLRLAITGQLGPGAMTRDRVYEVLDLCLACKGCKNECPNNVDMAKLKAEVVREHRKAHVIKLRDWLFGEFPRHARLASGVAAQLVNELLGVRLVKMAMHFILGIDRHRTLPRFAHQRLSAWYKQMRNAERGMRNKENGKRVALFNDTYLEHHQPEIGRAAIEVLEAAGYAVELVSPGCCQRPAISKGMLDEAKYWGTLTLKNLDVYAREGVPILVCEPSCASALTDDLPDLIDDEELGKRVAACVFTLEQFLEKELADGRCSLPWKQNATADAATEILFHGHCHQKAMGAAAAARRLLERIPGAKVREIECGCCGMAGAFGYEKEHYELSMQVGEDRLFPALRAAGAEARIVADGFSCRHQIRDGVDKQARHSIEVVRENLEIKRS